MGKNLNYIHFYPHQSPPSETNDPFMIQMLTKFHETLEFVSIPKFVFPDITFPNLKTLHIEWDLGENINWKQFELNFPLVIKNMQSLKTVRLELFILSCIKEIVENYGKHCISLRCDRFGIEEGNPQIEEVLQLLNIAPVKIVTGLPNVEFLDNSKSAEHLCFLDMYMNPEDPSFYGWTNYKNVFDQCSNLKQISITRDFPTNSLKYFFPQMSEQNKAIWRERMTYFEKRGIKIVEKNKIYENENLRAKVAQEAGLRWKFHFW